MGLGEDKGVVPRFCDEMFACIQSKEKQQPNVILISNINFTADDYQRWYLNWPGLRFTNYVQISFNVAL